MTADQGDWWFIGGNIVRNTRFAVGSSVLASAVVLAGLLPGVTATADAVVSQDKMAMLTGAASSDFANVAVANADGTGLKVIRKGTKTQAPGAVALAPINNRVAVELDDSTKDSSTSTIAVMNVDGSGYRVLVHTKAGEAASQLHWNAAGTKLLVSIENDVHFTSYLATLNLGVAHPGLVKLGGSTGLHNASFSPLSDGTVVATDDAGSILTLTGGHTTLVLSGGASGGFADPVFSPDGGSIAFSAFGSGTTPTSRIEKISADGLVGPTVLDGSGLNMIPFWSSDGQSVAYDRFSSNFNSFKPYRVAADGGSAPAVIPFPAGKLYLVFDQAARTPRRRRL